MLPVRACADAEQAAPIVLSSAAVEAKKALIDAISKLNAAKDRDGDVPVDFGVKGGELDKDSRAPRNLVASGAYYAVSEDVGRSADSVMQAVEALRTLNPTPDATRFFGTAEGKLCPLNGTWRNIFTTAADATFSAKSKRGNARASNEVDGVSGVVWNVIDFLPIEGATQPPPVEQFRVRLSATATSPSRIELIFRLVKLKLTKFALPLPLVALPVFGLLLQRYQLPLVGGLVPLLLSFMLAPLPLPPLPVPLFGKRLTLLLPVPAPTLTRVLTFFRKNKKIPTAYFDVIYLDDDLRVHETGQGNIFVQQKEPLV